MCPNGSEEKPDLCFCGFNDRESDEPQMKKKCTAEKKLIDEGWFESREEMIPWIMARQVLFDNVPVLSASEKVSPDAQVRIKEYYKKKYTSKGGLKLEHALKTFNVDPRGKTALDCGASTGGFTDCLLVFGAELVYAVDAGFGQLAAKLVSCPKVVNMERTNISDEVLLNLDPKPDIITLDLSYLPLEKGLMDAERILAENGVIIALVKPIYETGDMEVRRSGDINHFDLHYDVLTGLCRYCTENGMNPEGVTYSPVTGNNGAVEYFLYLTSGCGGCTVTDKEITDAVNAGLELDKFRK